MQNNLMPLNPPRLQPFSILGDIWLDSPRKWLSRVMRLLLTSSALYGMTVMNASAHHSYAMFDMQKVTEIKGTVKEFHYTNPHSWIVLLIQDASGKSVDASLEANGPGYLVRFGWKRDSLKAGDAIVVSMNPLRDGAPGGSLVKVAFPDGRELLARPNGGPPPDEKK